MAPKQRQKIEIEKTHRDPLLSFNQAVTVDCSDFLGTALICSLKFSKSSANLFWFSRQNCKASRIVEDSFDGVFDPVDTSNRPIAQVGPKLSRSPFESSQ